MKKLLLVLSIILTVTASCKKEETYDFCYVFTTTSELTTAPPTVAGYPQTNVTTTEQCGLTELEAKTLATTLTTTHTQNTGLYIIVNRQVTTYKKK